MNSARLLFLDATYFEEGNKIVRNPLFSPSDNKSSCLNVLKIEARGIEMMFGIVSRWFLHDGFGDSFEHWKQQMHVASYKLQYEIIFCFLLYECENHKRLRVV